jgi:hypothetical protein
MGLATGGGGQQPPTVSKPTYALSGESRILMGSSYG